jgi:hypothetical protein
MHEEDSIEENNFFKVNAQSSISLTYGVGDGFEK